MGNYVQGSMNKNEAIVQESKQHWIALLPRGVIAFFILIAGLSDTNALVACLFIDLLIMAGPLIRLFCTELAITNKRLIGKVGLINTKTLDSPLNKINNASVSSGLFGKILGYGIMHITTSSGSYTFKGVAHPEHFKSTLMNQIDQFDEDRIKKQAQEMANAIKESVQ